jgi:aminopeptidase-like protein
MGKRKLYPTLSNNKINQSTKDIMNFLAYSDGKNDIENISKYINKSYLATNKIYNFLIKNNLIE